MQTISSWVILLESNAAPSSNHLLCLGGVSILKANTLNVGEFDTANSALWHRFSELWRYRELIQRLAVKDIKLRYKGSFLGFLWSLVNPLLMGAVFFAVFNVILPQGDKNCMRDITQCKTTVDIQLRDIHNHYAAFILIGVLAWNFTSSCVTQGMAALLSNASMIKKVYFPRAVLPIATVLSLFVNYLLALVVLFAVIIATGVPITGLVLLLPLFLFFHMLFMMGIALFLSALTVFFRDLTVIMDVLITAWFFMTPVFYTMKQVYTTWNGIDVGAVLYWVNPIASFVESYRNILFFNVTPDLAFTLRTCTTGLVMFMLGFSFFILTTRSIGEKL